MSKITRNSTVTLYHQLGLTDGSLLEDTFNDEPMTFQLGSGELAEGLEFAIMGLEEGDEQTLDISPEMAFGFPDEDAIQTIDRDEFNPDMELQPGLIIEFSTPSGDSLPGTILDIGDDTVTVDFNHPLAGQTVRYTVKIVKVVNTDEHAETIS